MNVSNVANKNALRASSMVGGLRRQRTFNAPLTDSLFASGKGSTTPTFTRASTAYVTDYENIPRKVLSGEARFHGALRVHNQFLQSQNFSSGVWGRSAMTASTLTGLPDPFGGTTAMKMVVDNGSSVIGNDSVGGMAQTVTKIDSVANVLAVSIYAKAGEAHVLRIRENTSAGFRAVFNLATGTVAAYEQSATKDSFGAQMTHVGDGWYRCQVRYTTGGGATQGFTFKSSGLADSTTGDGVSGLYLACAQYEDVTGSSVLATSPYVSNGALSTPWHGANVDGVKYFTSEEVHQQNLLRQSEDLANATYWGNAGTAPTTVVSAGNVGPFGGNATRIVFANGVISLRSNGVGNTILYGRSYKIGAWVKSNTGTDQIFRLNIFDSLGSFYSADFTATNEWQYFTHGPIVSMGTTGYLCRIANGTAFDPCDILVGGMTCFEDSPYISTEYVSNADDRAGLPIPTGEYVSIPSTTNLGYVSEASSTNVCRQSQTFETTWTATDTTVLTNQTPAPDGTITSDRFGEGSAGTAIMIQSGIVISANTYYTASVYIRPGTPATAPFMRMRFMAPGGLDGVQAWFNMTTGTVGTVQNVGTGTGGTATITLERNGFYRCSISAIIDASSTASQFQVCSATADASTTRFANAVYYLWGAQVESGQDVTSYIPTTTANVTRSSDYLTYPNTGNVNDAVSTLYAEYKRFNPDRITGDRRGICLAGYTNNRVHTMLAQSLILGTHVLVGNGAGTNATLPYAINLNTTLRKVAIAWENGVINSLRCKVNTETMGVNAAATPSVVTSAIVIGGVDGNALQPNTTIRNVKLWKVRMSDNQLTQLTA